MSDYGRDVAALAIVTVLTLVYTFEGGMTAVIWTDVVQLALCLGGALLAVFGSLTLSPGRMGDHSLRGRRGGQVSHH